MAQDKTRGLRTDPRITLLVAYNKDEMKELTPAIIPLNEFLSFLRIWSYSEEIIL